MLGINGVLQWICWAGRNMFPVVVDRICWRRWKCLVDKHLQPGEWERNGWNGSICIPRLTPLSSAKRVSTPPLQKVENKANAIVVGERFQKSADMEAEAEFMNVQFVEVSEYNLESFQT
jgi:hypothetical protein